MDVEAAELLLLPFSSDGERARDELVEQSSYHTSNLLLKIGQRDSESWARNPKELALKP